MTVAELIERLEDLDPDTTVRIAYQPSYPLAANVANVAVEMGANDKAKEVWIAATSTVRDINPYAPRDAWTEEEFGGDEEEDDED